MNVSNVMITLLVLLTKEKGTLQDMFDRLVNKEWCYWMEINLHKSNGRITVENKELGNDDQFRHLRSIWRQRAPAYLNKEIILRNAVIESAFTKKMSLLTSNLILELRKKQKIKLHLEHCSLRIKNMTIKKNNENYLKSCIVEEGQKR